MSEINMSGFDMPEPEEPLFEAPPLPEEPVTEGLPLHEQQKLRQEYLKQLDAYHKAAMTSLRQGEDEVAKAQSALRRARQKRDAADAANREANAAMREERDKLAQLDRLITQQIETEEAERRAAERRKILDDLTANAPWRDRILPHQLDGAHYLSAAQRAICADEMGTGKTFQVGVVTLDMLEAMGDGGKKVLIVVPNELISNFYSEIETWNPERVIVKVGGLKGGLKAAIEAFDFYSSMLPEQGTYITSYELLRRSGSKELLDRCIMRQFDTVICDEAHKLKEDDRSTYKVIEQIVFAYNTCAETDCGKLVVTKDKDGDYSKRPVGFCAIHGEVEAERSVKNFIPMTGTPVLNRPEELYPLLHLANPRVFPRKTDFFYDYCTRGWDNKMKWKPGGESRLTAQIRGQYLRRTRDDAGIILPKQKITFHEIEFDKTLYPKQAALMEMLRKHAQIEIEEGRAADIMSVLALITRQRQATVWPGGIYMNLPSAVDPTVMVRTHVGANYLESAKLDWAVDLMDDFTEQEVRYVVFSQFKEPLIELKRRMGDRVVEFHGDVKDDVREQVKANFDRERLKLSGDQPKWDGVLAHYQVGGLGVTFTAATQVIILDEQWNPGMNKQAYDRVNRLGQTEETGVHIGRLSGSIDAWLAELIDEKRKIVEGFEMELDFQRLADVFMMS